MQAKAAAFGVADYDALLDEYEPGASADRIDALFADLAEFLPALIGEALERQAARTPPQRPPGPFAIDRQRALGLRLMRALGFDFDHGRLDVSAHPFTGGVPEDVRITTRYREPAAWRGQPVGEARGMVMHESQSLLIEMQVARGRPFLAFAEALIRAELAADGPAYALDNLAALYTEVRPGLIRVEADEVTYPAHVMLRYRLEQALLSGDLAIADLPGAWADGMKTLLGVDVPDDKDGCLQDIHWPSGSFGYFPTYTLGALAAAQLYRAARDQDEEIEPAIARGEFGPLLGWLRVNVHGQGSRYVTDELLERATGAPLGVEAFRRHLTERYLG
jgi:carboxypeptidase Taq